MYKKELKGKVFGRLTTTGFFKIIKNKCYLECICECGYKKHIRKYSLITGRTISCGCYKKQIARVRGTKHNLIKHPLYTCFHQMKGRCYNKNHNKYHRYGKRGIKVYKKWKDSFIVFYKWAISNGWKKGLIIDRIDNNGNYKPSNCRWVTCEESMQNTRRNKIWHIKRKKFNSCEKASEYFNVSKGTILRWCKNNKKEDCYSVFKYK